MSSTVWKHRQLSVYFKLANIKNRIARSRMSMAVVALPELKLFANERATSCIIAMQYPEIVFPMVFFPRHFHVTFSWLPNKNATSSLFDFETPFHDELSHKNQKHFIITRLSHSISPTLFVFVIPTSTVMNDALFQNHIHKSVFYRSLWYFLDQFRLFQKVLEKWPFCLVLFIDQGIHFAVIRLMPKSLVYISWQEPHGIPTSFSTYLIVIRRLFWISLRTRFNSFQRSGIYQVVHFPKQIFYCL